MAIPATFGEEAVQNLDSALLPADWRAGPAPASTRRLGDAWADNMTSALLRVPSTIVPQESNYLLNPRYPGMPVQIGEPVGFDFDPRLLDRA